MILCIGCGCSDLHACRDEQLGRACHWMRLDAAGGVGLCSACERTATSAVWDIAAVEASKLEVLYTRHEAWLWLRSHQRLLGGHCPLTLLHAGEAERESVRQVIAQLLDGVYV